MLFVKLTMPSSKRFDLDLIKKYALSLFSEPLCLKFYTNFLEEVIMAPNKDTQAQILQLKKTLTAWRKEATGISSDPNVLHWQKVDDGGDRFGIHRFPDGASGGKPYHLWRR